MEFTIKNKGKKEASVSLMGLLKNPLAWGEKDRKLANSIIRDNGRTMLVMKTGVGEPCATSGSMCFGVQGGNVSFITGEYRKYFTGYIPHAESMARPHMSVFHRFRDTGRLPDSPGEIPPTVLAKCTIDRIEAMSFTDKKELLDKLSGYAFVKDIIETVLSVDPAAAGTGQGIDLMLKNIVHHLDILAGRDHEGQMWGSGALCSQIDLAPEESATVVFVLSWYFPYHYSASGNLIGHRYENWYADAGRVASALFDNRNTWSEKTRLFSETLYKSSVPVQWADAWANQLSTLIKCTWWSRNGDFAVWEGLGCCGFHTIDITYQGSFGILALFPELQLRQMEMGAALQRDDGRVHHMFTPDLTKVDNGFDRVDMNQQFVLLVCRDYLWTGDREYLGRMWPHIVKAMDNTKQLDRNRDGLPDHDTRRNTYDGWNFFGTPSYISSLWISALLAGIRLAQEMGDERKRTEWNGILDLARTNFDRLLWNGEYYSLCADESKRDDCCMSDQIDGEWFTAVTGIGTGLFRKRITAALKAIYKYNFDPESGIRNALYPPGKKLFSSTYRNFQATGTWTGIEYLVVSFMLEYGLFKEARSILEAVDRCQTRAGRIWNHMECGDHYYRAMSSWSVLLSLTGFKVDVPRKTVTFSPVMTKGIFTGPWFSAEAWGEVSATRDTLVITCRSGRFSFRNLVSSLVHGRTCSLFLNDTQLTGIGLFNVDTLQSGNDIVLEENDILTINMG